MIKLILRILAIIFIAIFGVAVLIFIMKLVGLIVWLLIGALFIAGFIYLLKYLFSLSSKQETSQVEKHFVSEILRPTVALFLSEPTVKDLVSSQDRNSLSLSLVNGEVLELDNQTEVIVLSDREKAESIKIRVADGKYKGRDGWVCRSVLHSGQKLISD